LVHAAKIRTRIIPSKKKSQKIFFYMFEHQPFKAPFRPFGTLTARGKVASREKKINAAIRLRTVYITLITRVLMWHFATPHIL
jgi:hypothetical protein